MEPKKLIGLAMAAAIGAGVWWFATAGGDEKASVHIENSFNNWGKELGLTKEELIQLVDTSIRNKDDLKKNIVRLAHPDGSVASGSLVLNGDTVTSIPADVMGVIPQDYTRDAPDEPFKDFDSADVSIRAIDLDRPGSGWWALAPDISDKRLQLFLADDIDPMTLPYGRTVKADITVTYRVDNHGNKTPKKLQLRKLHNQQPKG